VKAILNGSRWTLSDKDGNVVGFVWLSEKGVHFEQITKDSSGRGRLHKSQLPWDKFSDAINGQLNFLP
jgi:hypothetical protein